MPSSNPNSFSTWFEPLRGDADLQWYLPTTEVVWLPQPVWAEEILDEPEAHLNTVAAEIERLAAKWQFGWPVFVRTNLLSGKHNYRDTCLMPDATALRRNLNALVEAHAMAAFTMQGDCTIDSFVVRKFLRLRHAFTAFNGLPIANEYRYFVTSGKIECMHPYWPVDAVRDGFIADMPRPMAEEDEGMARGWHGIPEGWVAMLAKMQAYKPTGWTHVERAGTVVEKATGFPSWSIDFAEDTTGHWWLIDMALAEESWHPPH